MENWLALGIDLGLEGVHANIELGIAVAGFGGVKAGVVEMVSCRDLISYLEIKYLKSSHKGFPG